MKLLQVINNSLIKPYRSFGVFFFFWDSFLFLLFFYWLFDKFLSNNYPIGKKEKEKNEEGPIMNIFV